MEILWEKLVFHGNSHLYTKKNSLIGLVNIQCDCFSTLTNFTQFAAGFQSTWYIPLPSLYAGSQAKPTTDFIHQDS